VAVLESAELIANSIELVLSLSHCLCQFRSVQNFEQQKTTISGTLAEADILINLVNYSGEWIDRFPGDLALNFFIVVVFNELGDSVKNNLSRLPVYRSAGGSEFCMHKFAISNQ